MVKQKSRGIASLPKRFDGWGGSYVDDGSDDQSAEETRRLAEAESKSNNTISRDTSVDTNPYLVGNKPGEPGYIPNLTVGPKPGESPVGSTTASNESLAKLNELKTTSPDLWTQLTKLPGQMVDKYLGAHTKADGSLDLMGIGKDLLSLGAGVAAYNAAGQPTPKTGYQGKIPKFTAVQSKATDPGADFRAGQGGHQYFTGLSFAKQDDPAGLAALQAANATELGNVNAANKARAEAYTAAHPAYVDNDPTGDKFFGRTDKTDLVPNTTKPFTNATVPGSTGIDTLPGGTKTDTITGGTGNDTLWSKFNPKNADQMAAIGQFGQAIKDLTASGHEDQAKALYAEKQKTFGFKDSDIAPLLLGGQFNAEQIGQWKGAQPAKNVAEPTVGGKDTLPPVDDFDINNKPRGLVDDRESTGFGEGQKRPGSPGGLSWENLLGPAGAIGGLGSTGKFNDEGMVAPNTPITYARSKEPSVGFGGGLGALVGSVSPDIANKLTDENKSSVANTDRYTPVDRDMEMRMAAGGTTSPRGTYLQGHTDGMADKIPGTIDGIQPARLAHGEFVVPADVVSHLGNGNSDAGAQQLYKMMDKIRMARTGTKDQGKRINPSKFMPGGIAGIKGYAQGGILRFAGTDGSTIPAGVIGQEQGLSDWAGDYTTNMMGQAQALVEDRLAHPEKYTYTGELSAGDSALQKQAYANAAKLAVPTSIGTAANTAGDLAGKMANLSYSPTTVQNAYTAPSNLGYTAERATAASFAKPEDIAAERVSSGPALTAFQMQAAQSGYAPSLTNYQAAAPAAVKTEKFIDPGTAQAYMSPYMQQVVENQQREAQRKADIESTSRHAGATQAGAFGGSRQAIMDAEAARNLATQKGDIQAQGLQNAYTNAQQQFNAEQGYGLQGQIANQGAGVTVGGQNLNASLATQQLGAQTGLQVALANLNNEQQAAVQNQASKLQAQGMTAQQALQAALANQSTGLQAAQANQGMAYNTAAQNAQLAQQTALANQSQANQAAQFGAGQNLASAQTAAQYGQAANALNAQNAQFGAQYGLSALQGSLGAAQAQGQLGTAQNQAGLANLSAQLGAGNQQQATTQAGDVAQKAAFDEQKMDPYNQINFENSLLANKPITATSYNFQNNPLTAAAGAAGTVNTALGGNTSTTGVTPVVKT